MNETIRSSKDNLNFSLTAEIVYNESESYSGWFARVLELPGCMTQADTLEEMALMIQEAICAWIETAIEDGAELPGS